MNGNGSVGCCGSFGFHSVVVFFFLKQPSHTITDPLETINSLHCLLQQQDRF